MSRRQSAWVVPAYALFSVVLTWPLALHFDRRLPLSFGDLDPLLQCFLLNWDWHALATAPLSIFNPPIFHPEPRALTYMDHLIGPALLAWPLAAWPVAAYNTLVLLATVASGWFMYRLTRLLGVSRAVAFGAGLLYAFGPFRHANLSNLNQLQTQFLPLGLFFGIRFLRRWRTRDLVGAGLTLVVQSWFGWYYVFQLGLALALLALWEWRHGRLNPRQLLQPRVGWTLLGGGLLILPGVLPYLVQQQAMPAFRRTLGMAALWSADLLDYARPRGEHAFLPGLLVAPLALWAWVRRRPGTGFMALLAGVGFVLSLGPLLHVAGRRLLLPLPYAAGYFLLPGFSSMRAPGRFALLVLLASVVTAALAADGWRRRWRPASLLLALGVAVSLVVSWPLPVALTEYPRRQEMPPVYDWLARQPGDFAILELPMPRRVTDESHRDIVRQVWTLAHGKRRLDGVSGFVPPDLEVFRMTMAGFPRPGVLRAAARRGARLLIVHYGDYEPSHAAELRTAAAASPGLKEMARFGDDVVYELTGV